MAEAVKVCWLSVDPVRRKLDFYPRAIASRIEKAYHERAPLSATTCVLGSDFFNATVHFHPSGSCYQTTPGMSMGRAGFKQPGYRSVKRVVKQAHMSSVQVYSKQVHGEWRIAANETDSQMRFEEEIPTDCLVDGSPDAQGNDVESFQPWRGEDLSSGAWDVSVVVWQWCRGVPERHGNLMALSEEWWCPYLAAENEAIERGFKSNALHTEIRVLERPLAIRFTAGSSFALQRDEGRGKERTVRRVVKTIQEVKVMLDGMASPPVTASDLSEVLPSGTIPHHFFCPIMQDVMNDPVMTIDGMTYDRVAIERWFMDHSTSPLTGLALSSKSLSPHPQLRDQIAEFVKTHAHLVSSQPPPAS